MNDKKYDVLNDVTNVDENLSELVNTKKLPDSPNPRDKDLSLIKADEHSGEIVDTIKSLSLIGPTDVKKLEEAKTFILSTYTDVPQYRPMVTKLTSVLTDGKFPTADKKYWQCKSEAEVHFNELCRSSYKHKRAVVDLEELDYKIKSIEDLLNESITPAGGNYDPNLVKFDLERLKIKRDQYEFEVKQLEKNMKFRIKEITDWHTVASYLEPQCRYSVKDYEEHVPESHYKVLEYRVEQANNEEERRIFQEQLDTFKNILKQSNKAPPKGK